MYLLHVLITCVCTYYMYMYLLHVLTTFTYYIYLLQFACFSSPFTSEISVTGIVGGVVCQSSFLVTESFSYNYTILYILYYYMLI